jgi:hypothetical protein
MPGVGVLTGRWLWVWHYRPEVVETARRIHATGLLVKALDGLEEQSGETNWPEQYQWARAECQPAGLDCIPWAYSYGEAGEVAKLAGIARDRRIIVDPEIEFEQAPAETQDRFIAEIATARASGVHVWVACWCDPRAHPGYPTGRLAAVSDGLIPMIAWQVSEPRAVGHWLEAWEGYGWQAVPWLPSTEGVTPEELRDSVLEAERRFGGSTIWEASALTREQVEALAARPPAVIDALHGVWHYLEQAERAIGQARGKVVDLKAALGLS